MKILLAETNSKNGKNAGSKARIDVLHILKNIRFTHISLYNSKTSRIMELTSVIKAFVKLWFVTRRGSIIFVEHPYSPFRFCAIVAQYVSLIKVKRNCSTILLIHDIESLRYGKIGISTEIDTLNKYDIVICHNNIMKEWLIENGLTTEIVPLTIFDYLSRSVVRKRGYCESPTICFAGNLKKEKSGFIYELGKIESVHFNLYGNEVQIKSQNVKYMGSYSPSEIVSALEGNYGLVWDGASVSENDSDELNYLKIISPHKFSLYLAAGLPVIVWEKSALADFVKAKRIGLLIRDLKELPEALNKVTKKDYSIFLNNISQLQEFVRSGYYLTQAVMEIEGIKHDEN